MDRFESFLNDIERITKRDYEPSDDDVIRARLRTVGVQEYSFSIEQGKPFLFIAIIMYVTEEETGLLTTAVRPYCRS